MVSMNYRVASLGFLFLNGRSDAPGNAALFDQLLALQWVQENIGAFGGDPESVTLFGESSGAVSISYLLISPLSRNLFHRAILQSAGATNPWSLLNHTEAVRRTLRLAQAVGCPYSMSEADEIMDCLRRTDPMDLVTNETGVPGVIDFPFVPVVDGSFLDELPEVSLKSRNFKKAQLLLGTDQEEGYYWLIYYLTDWFKKEEDVYISPEDFKRIVPLLNPEIGKAGHEAVMFEYTPWHDPTNAAAYRDAVDKIVGDYQFTCATNEMALHYAASGNDVFVYYFTHRSSISPWPKWTGVIHGDEINFVFGEPLNLTLSYRREEIDLSRRIMRYWANFARTGSVSR